MLLSASLAALLAASCADGAGAGASDGAGMGIGFLGSIKESDALLHVVRCFENDGVHNPSGSIDPASDAEIVEMELMQADLQTLRRNVERVGKKARTGDKDARQALACYNKAVAALEAAQLRRRRHKAGPIHEG